jgi:hypothetical protein
MEFVERRFIRLMWHFQVTIFLPVTMPHFYTFQTYFCSPLEPLERDEIMASLRQLLGLSTISIDPLRLINSILQRTGRGVSLLAGI